MSLFSHWSIQPKLPQRTTIFLTNSNRLVFTMHTESFLCDVEARFLRYLNSLYLSVRRSAFGPRPVCVRFFVENAALAKALLQVYLTSFLGLQEDKHSITGSLQTKQCLKNSIKLDATYYFTALLMGSTCFEQYYAHH